MKSDWNRVVVEGNPYWFKTFEGGGHGSISGSEDTYSYEVFLPNPQTYRKDIPILKVDAGVAPTLSEAKGIIDSYAGSKVMPEGRSLRDLGLDYIMEE